MTVISAFMREDHARPAAAPSAARPWLRLVSTWAILALALTIGAACTRHSAPDVARRAELAPSQGAQVAGPRTAPATAKRFLIAAADPLAAQAGAEVLRSGGSAVDAAIAAELVLNLVEPQSSGIGGGGFLLHYAKATGAVTAYDGRETAPAGAGHDMFLRPSGEPMGFLEAAVGGLSVGVPGLLRMLERAHRDHGRLPWARLFEPAIRLAESGAPVSPRLHAALARDSWLATMPGSARHYYGPDGGAKPAGAALPNPALARTLSAIAAGGADTFYVGAIAADIVAAVAGDARNPGRLALADLARYEARTRAPLCRPYRVWIVCGMPPPSSGGVTVLEILGTLERFPLGALAPGSPEAAHLLAESSRLAFADRNALVADPAFVPVPVDAMLDRAYLDRRARLISPDRALPDAEPGLSASVAPAGADVAASSTTHVSVVDAEGNAVALTSSIETSFGSRVMVRGFLLNNQLTDFAFRPVRDGRPVANRAEPGKRPLSAMAPTIVLDRAGRLVMVVGSPGGPRIIPYVAQTIVGVLDWKLDIQRALELPHVVNLDGATELEAGTAAAALLPELARRGHVVELRRHESGLHGIMVTGERLEGGADPRRGGVALGE